MTPTEIATTMRQVVAVERNGKHDNIPAGWLNTIEQWADLIDQAAEAADREAAGHRDASGVSRAPSTSAAVAPLDVERLYRAFIVTMHNDQDPSLREWCEAAARIYNAATRAAYAAEEGK